MRVNATLILAAIAALQHTVEADAFVSHTSTRSTTTTKHQQQQMAKMPITAAATIQRPSSSSSWSTTALEMSGGGEGGEAAISTEGTATIPDEIFNLVKSIVGAGVLSLPAGAYSVFFSSFIDTALYIHAYLMTR